MLRFKPVTGIIIVLVLVLTQGCVVSRGTVGEPLQEDAISAIKKGTTSMAEVVALIGAPDRIIRGNDRDIFHYYYYDGKSPALLLLLLTFIRMDIKSADSRIFTKSLAELPARPWKRYSGNGRNLWNAASAQ